MELTELLRRVESATGSDRELDRLIGEALDVEQGLSGDVVGLGYPKLSHSLDAALALTERLLCPALLDVGGSWEPNDKAVWPAWTVRWYPSRADRDGKSWHAQIGSAATPALALLSALLKALITQASTPTGSADKRGRAEL